MTAVLAPAAEQTLLSAADDAQARPRALAVLQDFLTQGGDPNVRVVHHHERMGLLSACSLSGWHDAVQALIAGGADVHADDDNALRASAREGQRAAVQCLLACGADVHADQDGALRRAAINGHPSVMVALLSAGADVHAWGDWSLRWAAIHGHHAVVDVLLAAGADVHAMDAEALRLAADHGHRSVVHSLLAAGADPVLAIRGARHERRARVLATLNAVAAAIPAEQRAAVLACVQGGLPALEALVRAEQRRGAGRCARA